MVDDSTGISPRCNHTACAIRAFPLRLFPAHCWLRPGCAYFEHVQNKLLERMHFPHPRDPTPPKPRPCRSSHVWPTIGHALGHFSIVVETASMCERGIRGVIKRCIRNQIFLLGLVVHIKKTRTCIMKSKAPLCTYRFP